MIEPNSRFPDWFASAATGDDLAAAALSLAQGGLPVFPCVPGAKRPLTPRGFHDATTEADQIRSWWDRTPQANIAIPTGLRSCLSVVDVDVHVGGNGYAAFERADAAGLTEGWAWLVRTPSGGLHAYYPSKHEEQRSWQAPGQHVDFRGDGGYIIAPPSRVLVDGRLQRYHVLTVAQHTPVPVNARSLRHFIDPPSAAPPSSLPSAGAQPDRLAAWMAARPEGTRNNSLYWAACRMAEDGHLLNTTIAVLGDAARRAGLPEAESESTIRSAHRLASRLSGRGGGGPATSASGRSL